ncbi:hypothetical protein B0A55_12806 [Friedmanniomyces simplex]|uniref:Ubiquitin carboxyl-terminal hydrolase n=1 Tax=Friedmanniomyces simplex TaxID=329884 RepID=A0A4U0W9Y9_9PEZI|nr:hypothetical protein B0A55_12806 [Friedmanniomyces simplex]
MNHPMSAGSGPPQQHISPALPMYPPQSRRQQEYHTYHQGGPPPHSPMHPQAYPGYNPHYYPHPPPIPYQQQPRWQPPYAPPYVPSPQPRPNYQQPPQQHYQPQQQPQQPMVVSSRPGPPPMMPDTRLPPMPPQNLPSHSPAPMPPRSYPPPQQTPLAPPSPAPTPKHETPSAPPPPPAEQEPVHDVGNEEAQKNEHISPRDGEISAPASRRQSQAQLQSPLSAAPEHKTPFYPKLPWYSVPDAAFPRRDMARRRRKQALHKTSEDVALPAAPAPAGAEAVPDKPAEEAPSEASTIAAPSEPETPATSQAPSESEFTQVSTPATPAQAVAPSPKATLTQKQARRDTRTAIAVPNIPGLPKPKSSPPAAEKQVAPPVAPSTEQAIPISDDQPQAQAGEQQDGLPEQAPADEESAPKTPPPKAPPKSWADLVRTKAAPGTSAGQVNGTATTNGTPPLPKSASLADALRQYSVQRDASLSFLEPRGLVNTGNMCYMNAILQVLVFCAPFYGFLDQVRQRTVHSMKSDTPLVDAMIMFMREFKVLLSAESVDVLRRMLKPEILEQYGEPVTPEYVYDAIRNLPRFQSMRRGHQQDAEEFLGFLLEGLHDECALVMQGVLDEQPHTNGVTSPDAVNESPTSADGWLEVGPKQKASTTRTAGQNEAPSPITKIFGGNLRSELRVPGVKDSITLEPYKPLQLDIGAQHVNNITDALKGLTRTESLSGDFGGRSKTAKKQVFIDTLPPVLILHLKRFQYENNLTGTQKIWKKIGYPLELEIPKDVFPTAKRGGFAAKGGLPKYRLIGVVYHHGKSAAGGHYTVDILRQDSREWIRMDDTVIRRIRPEDVAEGGSEEDPKILAKALEQHKADQEMQKQRNIYQGLDEAEKEPEEEKPWSEVNGGSGGGGEAKGHKKQWSTAVTTNGTATPVSTTGKRTPTTAKREGVKDSKVAYILLYERMSG